MISPKDFEAIKLEKFGEQCRELEKMLDKGLNDACSIIVINGKSPDDVINKVRTRYERAGWSVTISYNTWLFRAKE